MPLPSAWWRWHFNRESKAWDRRSTDPVIATRADGLVKWLVDALPDDEGRVLDVGCGPGAHARRFRQFVVGTDLAPGMLERAAAHGGVALSRSDLGRGLPFRDDAFTGVLGLLVLHHVPSIPSALRELQRVVRPGGALVLSFPAREFVAGRPGLYWRIRGRVGRVPGVIHRLSEAGVRAAVVDFELLDLRREGGAHAVLVRNPEAL